MPFLAHSLSYLARSLTHFQWISSPATSWAFRRSKCVSSMGEYAGSSKCASLQKIYIRFRSGNEQWWCWWRWWLEEDKDAGLKTTTTAATITTSDLWYVYIFFLPSNIIIVKLFCPLRDLFWSNYSSFLLDPTYPTKLILDWLNIIYVMLSFYV